MVIEPSARLLAIAAACAALSCGQPPAATKTQAATPKGGVFRYMPLEDGTVFSYETSTQPSGEKGLLVLEIRRPRAESAELVVAGRARRLEVTESALAHVTGGFLLKEPLATGAEWKGDFGRVRVTNTERAVTVPAGEFVDCLETVEEATNAEGSKKTTTAYCPGIGIALRETEAEQEAEYAVERIALKSWGKRFNAVGDSMSIEK
jgi:hypothetical protein